MNGFIHCARSLHINDLINVFGLPLAPFDSFWMPVIEAQENPMSANFLRLGAPSEGEGHQARGYRQG
jgi:hypothetical protein